MTPPTRPVNGDPTAGASENLADPQSLQALPNLDPLPDLPNLPNLPPLPDLPRLPDLPNLPPLSKAAPDAAGQASISDDRFTVNARDGVRLRSGPDVNFPIIKTVPFGTPVSVIKRDGAWAQVDLEGDGAADGFVHASFLEPAATAKAVPQPTAVAAPVGNDILEAITPEMVSSIFTPATKLTNIKTNLPFVLAGLRAQNLGDKAMALMALGTIRAETESFVPISEGKSHFNTLNSPFDLYDAGTPKGKDLGNTEPGDGPFFKGRGYVQLTGRFNYTVVGRQISQPLATQPELANDPSIAGLVLAVFLRNRQTKIRAALEAGNLALARKLVNGGSNGLDRFSDTYHRGLAVLPG